MLSLFQWIRLDNKCLLGKRRMQQRAKAVASRGSKLIKQTTERRYRCLAS